MNAPTRRREHVHDPSQHQPGAGASRSAIAALGAAAMPAAAGRLPGARACPLFPRDNVWNMRVDHLPVHPDSDDARREHRARRAPPPRLRLLRGLRHPLERRHARRRSARRSRSAGRANRTRARTRSRRSRRSRAAATATSSWWTRTAASCSSCSRRAAQSGRWRRARARSGTCARTGSGPPAGRARTRPACRSCPASSASTRSATARSPHALRFTAPLTRRAYVYPARHYASEDGRHRPPADGPSRPPQGVGRHQRLPAPGAHPAAGPAALRDDPRRQRLALVRHRRAAPALGRRRASHCSTASKGSDFEVVDTSSLRNGD